MFTASTSECQSGKNPAHKCCLFICKSGRHGSGVMRSLRMCWNARHAHSLCDYTPSKYKSIFGWEPRQFVFTDFHCRRNCVCLFKSDPTLEFNPLQPNTVTAKDSSCCDPRVRVCVCDWPPWENHGMCLDPGKQRVSQSASQSPWCVYGTKSSVKVQSIRTVRLQA